MDMWAELRRSCCTRASELAPSCNTQARQPSRPSVLTAPLLITTGSIEKLRKVPLKTSAVTGFSPIRATLAADLACGALAIASKAVQIVSAPLNFHYRNSALTGDLGLPAAPDLRLQL